MARRLVLFVYLVRLPSKFYSQGSPYGISQQRPCYLFYQKVISAASRLQVIISYRHLGINGLYVQLCEVAGIRPFNIKV